MVAPRTTRGGSFVILLLLPALSLSASTLPIPNPIKYIGIGYNILDGNPEGDNRVAGGVDPGLLVSRRIFKLTYDNGKTTNDNEYRVPDEVAFQERSSSFTSQQTDKFYGTKSYAKKLSHQVKADASVEAVFASVKFSASHRYESISNDAKTKGYVYSSDQTIKNFGHMRYLSNLAEHDGFEIEREFRIEVCDLPTTYDTNTYMEFLSNWGTSVVTEADVGVRTGSNYREDRSSFVKEASTDMSNSVSVEGNYKIFSASLSVDMDRFTKSDSSEKNYGKEFTTYTIGSEEFNEPISINLIGLDEALDSEYWSRQSDYESSGECPSNWARETIQANILRALKEYPDYRGVIPSSDPDVSVPLTWPDGKYALPEAVTLNDMTCPKTNYMTWSFGLFYQWTDKSGINECTKNNHLTNYCDRDHMRTYYCVKTTPKATESSWSWMPGVYCIFKYGDTCPDGFTEGFIKWNDAGLQKGLDTEYNTAPAGNYYPGATQIEFCCREDGSTRNPIFLPTESPFFLIQYHEACQQVHGMTVSEEYLQWATKEVNPSQWQGGAYPKPGNTGREIRINYCFYQPTASKRDGMVAELFDERNDMTTEKPAMKRLELLLRFLEILEE